jgi:aspartyl-tRNA(Asn)/glutamyl-tRNA(Gln) amidotransferase subunit A
VAGPDDRDRFSLPAAGVGYEQAIDTLPVAGLRARWSADMGFARCDPEVRALTEAAARELAEAAGLALDDEPVALTDPVRTWLGSGTLDLWLSLEPGMWPGVAPELTRYTRSVLEQTEHYPVPKVAEAARRREQLVLDAAQLFADVDVVVTPTTAVPAFPAAGPPPDTIDGEPARPLGASATPFTMLANLCWNPAISVPVGTTVDGLPVGLQIMAARHRDELPLRLARIWEQARPWPRHAPEPG